MFPRLNKIAFVALLAAVVAMSVLLSAQRAAAPPLPIASATKPEIPAVDELTRTKAERAQIAEQLAGVTAQLQICTGQLAPAVYQQNLQEVSTERARIVDAFERANPGYTLDLKTMAVSKKGGGGQ